MLPSARVCILQKVSKARGDFAAVLTTPYKRLHYVLVQGQLTIITAGSGLDQLRCRESKCAARADHVPVTLAVY